MTTKPYTIPEANEMGTLKTGRIDASVHLLSNGHLVVYGGFRAGKAIGKIEQYNPSLNEWDPGVDIPTDKASRLITLEDGRLLTLGIKGYGVYDPLNLRWVEGKGSWTARIGYSATTLSDGRVLLVGGNLCSVENEFCGGDATNLVEIFDPREESLVLTATLPRPSAGHTATLMKDGRVLITGGVICKPGVSLCSSTSSSAELFDPSTNRWIPVNSMMRPREGHAAIVLNDGRILIVGGRTGDVYNPFNTDSEIYDSVANDWSLTSLMRYPRVLPRLRDIGDGRILVIGGVPNVPAVEGNYAESEIYDLQNGHWQSTVDKKFNGSVYGVFSAQSGTTLAVGFNKFCGGWIMTSVEVFDPQSDRWTDLPVLTGI
ncbi:MAG: hypothetical protein FJ320_04540 [SAR202 cluster bacterium]|nr:hypothetical protein [SAR202 cluster bacterium]